MIPGRLSLKTAHSHHFFHPGMILSNLLYGISKLIHRKPKGDKGYVIANINHNLFNLMAPYATPYSPPINYEENSDLFAGPDYCQPCFTNPRVVEIITENARQQLRADPSIRIFSLGFEDNEAFCTCEGCRFCIYAV